MKQDVSPTIDTHDTQIDLNTVIRDALECASEILATHDGSIDTNTLIQDALDYASAHSTEGAFFVALALNFKDVITLYQLIEVSHALYPRSPKVQF